MFDKKEEEKMTTYEITYTYNGKQYSTVEQPTKGWEGQFLQKVLDRIESLVMSGAVINDLRKL
jgi:hypothetical protein